MREWQVRRDDQCLALQAEGYQTLPRSNGLRQIVAIAELDAGVGELQRVVKDVAGKIRFFGLGDEVQHGMADCVTRGWFNVQARQNAVALHHQIGEAGLYHGQDTALIHAPL